MKKKRNDIKRPTFPPNQLTPEVGPIFPLFGSYDTKTGKCKEGYIDENGDMKFKDIPWYKQLYYKIFGKGIQESILPKEDLKTEYICVIHTKSNTSAFITNRAALYKTFNIHTGEIKEIFAVTKYKKIYFNVDAYVKDDTLIEI